MSAHYWRNTGRPAKSRFVGLEGGYHGETVGALAVTDIAIFREAYAPLVRLADTVPSPDARGAAPGETAQDVARRAAAALEAWLQEHHATTAALIVEPLVQCAAGMAMHDPEYLRLARALCSRYEVHLVVDEIAVGFGRTGTMFPTSRPESGRISFACPKVSQAAHCRCRPCSPPMRSTPRSTTTTWRAAFGIRTRTPATRWPAARRWPRWNCLSNWMH